MTFLSAIFKGSWWFSALLDHGLMPDSWKVLQFKAAVHAASSRRHSSFICCSIDVVLFNINLVSHRSQFFFPGPRCCAKALNINSKMSQTHVGKVGRLPQLPDCLDIQGFSVGRETWHLLFGIIIFMAFLSGLFFCLEIRLTLWPPSAPPVWFYVVLAHFCGLTCSKHHLDGLTETVLCSSCYSSCLTWSGSQLHIRKSSSWTPTSWGRCWTNVYIKDEVN